VWWLEPDLELQMEQLRVVAHISMAFWFTVRTMSKDEVGGTALKLWRVWRTSRQALKQLQVVVLAKHSSMKRFGFDASRGSRGSEFENWYGFGSTQGVVGEMDGSVISSGVK